MSVKRGLTALAAIAGVAGLSGCGNKTDENLFLKSLTQRVKGETVQAGPMSPEQAAAGIQAALANTDLPVAFVAMPDREANAVMVHIETNGAYKTWGGGGRRSITMAGGMITATRGLGNDIMSSSVGEIASLIQARKAGSGQHVLRHLNGENQTVETVADCQVTRGGRKKVTNATMQNVNTTEMTENCSGSDASFTNSYLVDGRGRVLQSRQWLGPANGYIVFQTHR
ncbi:YjbF family lipoprotein [Alisedimentitalea sp. MJ-SS2]|uniref:YjbF family lipoprotein n=1 Tax=Aliisedimentitalea sp. MJ-SS2 TaxID=3049795 RepID=UPI00290FB7AE|nr:YjbF family lipoprotein [Alisedimentitalea sp. MJ-SS2]MDU8929615.1 YjbF family lipoprotein [Alisedimentitalea sp. MJ-SS2]